MSNYWHEPPRPDAYRGVGREQALTKIKSIAGAVESQGFVGHAPEHIEALACKIRAN